MIGKRQLRNPRVKHRLKYKKALLKRKSQVNFNELEVLKIIVQKIIVLCLLK